MAKKKNNNADGLNIHIFQYTNSYISYVRLYIYILITVIFFLKYNESKNDS